MITSELRGSVSCTSHSFLRADQAEDRYVECVLLSASVRMTHEQEVPQLVACQGKSQHL